MNIEDIKLVRTCYMCPEQYDAFDANGRQIAYLHLRHGSFTVRCPDAGGELIYSVRPNGDGMFYDYERLGHLSDAKAAIASFYNKNAACETWGTPFDPSMLDGDVLIFCPSKDLASELMDLLDKHGVKWDLGCSLLKERNFWMANKEKTCYRVNNRRMGYSEIDYYDRSIEYRCYIKSTFYGAEQESDFEVSDEEFEEVLLGI